MARLKVARHRQRIANGLFEALGKNAHETLAFEGIFEPRIKRIDVDGQAPLAPHEVIEVFVHGKNIFRIQAKSLSDATVRRDTICLVRSEPDLERHTVCAGGDRGPLPICACSDRWPPCSTLRLPGHPSIRKSA